MASKTFKYVTNTDIEFELYEDIANFPDTPFAEVEPRKWIKLGAPRDPGTTPLWLMRGSTLFRHNYIKAAKIVELAPSEWTVPGWYDYTVPVTGNYILEIAGAGGGAAFGKSSGTIYQAYGGSGNKVTSGSTLLTKGTIMRVYVPSGGIGNASVWGSITDRSGSNGGTGLIQKSGVQVLAAEGGLGGYLDQPKSGKFKIYHGANSGNGQGGVRGIYPNNPNGNGGNGWGKITYIQQGQVYNFTTPGVHIWTAPLEDTIIYITATGAGGAGCKAETNPGVTTSVNGGAGALTSKRVLVSGGSEVRIVVGEATTNVPYTEDRVETSGPSWTTYTWQGQDGGASTVSLKETDAVMLSCLGGKGGKLYTTSMMSTTTTTPGANGGPTVGSLGGIGDAIGQHGWVKIEV